MAAPEDADPRPTLASRLAERNRLRALRAERLARLRAAPAPAAPEVAAAPAAPEVVAAAAADDDAEAALTDFLRALAGEPSPARLPAAPGAILHFQRPGRAADPAGAGELLRLPGVGDGLAWALGRAGVRGLADLAALEAAELVQRLGPIGRLIPAQGWIDAARQATG